MQWILPAAAMCLFFGIPAVSLSLTGAGSAVRSAGKKGAAAMGALSVGFVLVVMALITKERYVYFWDYGSYWYKTLQFQNTLLSGPSKALAALLSSINNDEYNCLACAVIALPLKLCGNSYASFVVLNTVLFYIPNAFLMAVTFYKILEKYSLDTIGIGWIYAYTLLFSVALFPILAGYVDIIGMIPLTTAYLLVIDRDFEQVEDTKDILLGTSLLWVVMLRRYYAYAVVGGAVFALLFWGTYGATGKNPFYRIKNKLIDTVITVAVPAFVLVMAFCDFLVKSVFNNHSYAYSAYKWTDFLGAWGMFGRYFGLLFIVLAILGVLRHIRGKAGKLVIGLLAGMLTSCTLFFRIQNMGEQHYYIAVFPMCCLIFLGIHALLFMPAPRGRKFLSAGIKGIAAIVVIGNFILSMGFGAGFRSILWESNSYVPKVRHDFEALNSLETCLEDLVNDGFRGVYCVGSGYVFNSDVLYKLNAPDAYPPFSIAVSDVDLRDGFRTSFFDSDIIIACDPAQTHLSHGQEIVLKLNEVMLTDNIFRENYALEDVFELDKGVRAMVYVKREPLDAADIEYIRDIYQGIYPDYPELFADRIDAYLSSLRQGEAP